MSTLQTINNELLTLPGDLQRKVLTYLEWLKYKDSVQKASDLTSELNGIRTYTEEDLYRIFEQQVQGLSQEELQDHIAIAERVNEVLSKMKRGIPGISHETMKHRVQQWQNK